MTHALLVTLLAIRNGADTASKVAGALKVERATATNRLQRLEKAGLATHTQSPVVREAWGNGKYGALRHTVMQNVYSLTPVGALALAESEAKRCDPMNHSPLTV